MNPAVIAKKDAIAAGLLKYCTGKLCRHGHYAERYVSDSSCVQCSNNRSKSDKARLRNSAYGKQRRQDPDHVIYQSEYQAEYRKTEQSKEYSKAYYGDPIVAERQRLHGIEFRKTEKSKNWYLTKKYGLSFKDKVAMVRAQNDLCAICKCIVSIDKGKSSDSACVDHCHETGQIRGILCSNCNKGLGLFKDNIPSLEQAIKYLMVSKGEI